MTLITGLLVSTPVWTFAWSPSGHRVTGRAALGMLDETARTRVIAILSSGLPGTGNPDTARAIDQACNWPDSVRKQPGWEWSAPLHYVNIPRGANHYDRQRDCRDGMCVTEGILKYAAELQRDDLSPQRRWQALAFLCHLVGDIHQPLHAGFRDDRGANTVRVEYHGEQWNLHQFWDGVLIRERMHDEDAMVARLSHPGTADEPWSLLEPAAWTSESHGIARRKAYPAGTVINDTFANESWPIILGQLELASLRLARILNAVLGEGAVESGR